MARSVMRLGPVHVLVVASSASLRESIGAWLRKTKRVRIVGSVARADELDGHRVECDLVVASALEGTRDLRAIGRRFRASAGLVALTLGTAPLPAGWVGVRPGASRTAVLDHAVAHPERSFQGTGAIVSAAVLAMIAMSAAFLYVPQASVSAQRAALAYAIAFPDTGTWWHVWGAGGPYLASAEWPLLKAAAIVGGGTAAFVQLAGAVAALYAVAFLLLAIRVGARRYAFVVGLAAMVLPGLWVWPRGGDAASLAGLAGVVLALAGTRVGRLRVLTAAIAVAVSSFAGYLWVAAAAIAAIASGIRAGRGRASAVGAVLGVLVSSAVALPPVLTRGLEGLLPPLPRPMALSDAVPVLASAALLMIVLPRERMRRRLVSLGVVLLAAANVLAFAVPAPSLELPSVRSTGPFGRLAVHPGQALAILGRQPDLPLTGNDVDARVMLGEEAKEVMNARLEWLGVDRAMLPDRSSAIIFNERDWSVLDRELLILGAPRVRPILTAGTAPTLLVVADEVDARTFGEALIRLGATSDRIVPVRALRSLDELDRDTLRDFTMLVVYGQPWKDVARAEEVLGDYLQLSGFVLMDAAGRPGPQPLVPEARPALARPDDIAAVGELRQLITADQGFEGRVVAIDRFDYNGDEGWEQAALVTQNDRLIQFGTAQIAGDVNVSAHLVWSGVDLPGRGAAGDPRALLQLQSAIAWMLGAANVPVTGGYGLPGGDVLDNETGTSEFLSPTHWRITLKVATNGVLFKQRYHEQWRAYQVDIMPLTGAEARTPLKVRPTATGHMFVTLPPNARVVDFVFERHPFEGATRAVSGIALFATLGLSFFLWRRR